MKKTPAIPAGRAANARTRPTTRSRLSAIPKSADTRASLEHALLGLIWESPGITGYDTLKVFDLSASHFWHAHQGQIYPTLDRMERAGWIKSRKVVQRGRPNKRVYTITPDGERVMLAWLRSPYEHARFKHAPLLRTRFLGHLSADEARAALEAQREAWVRYLDILRDIESSYFDREVGGESRDKHTAPTERAFDDVNAMFSYFTLRYGIAYTEMNLAWCDESLVTLERNRGLFESAGAGQSRKSQPRPPVSF